MTPGGDTKGQSAWLGPFPPGEGRPHRQLSERPAGRRRVGRRNRWQTFCSVLGPQRQHHLSRLHGKTGPSKQNDSALDQAHAAAKAEPLGTHRGDEGLLRAGPRGDPTCTRVRAATSDTACLGFHVRHGASWGSQSPRPAASPTPGTCSADDADALAALTATGPAVQGGRPPGRDGRSPRFDPAPVFFPDPPGHGRGYCKGLILTTRPGDPSQLAGNPGSEKHRSTPSCVRVGSLRFRFTKVSDSPREETRRSMPPPSRICRELSGVGAGAARGSSLRTALRGLSLPGLACRGLCILLSTWWRQKQRVAAAHSSSPTSPASGMDPGLQKQPITASCHRPLISEGLRSVTNP